MTGLFYNEYPPATSCLRSMTYGRLAGIEIAQSLGKSNTGVSEQEVKADQEGKQHTAQMVTASA